MMTNKIVTIERHISEEQQVHKGATGEFSRLMRDLTLAIRIISREVRRAGLNDILGLTDAYNVHGENQKKLDTYANDVIFRAMDHGGHLCVMGSEENDDPIEIPEPYEHGKYVLLYDPLDGSSNIEVNATIGTIFSVYRRVTPDYLGKGTMDDILQPGWHQVAAGYACYGSSTQLIYTTGHGVNIFTYDPTVGEFFLSSANVRIPKRGKYYSINEGNSYLWSEDLQRYISYLKTPSEDKRRPMGLRYIGSAVADIHRTLLYGGIFMYPADRKSPRGKLRLMYEANPLAMIIEQAGGRATDGVKRILELQPTELHERVPLYLGSEEDVLEAERFLRGEDA